MGLKKNIIELTRISESRYREMEKLPLSLMADNVRSMQNIGSMLRTCDAFKIKEMVMGGISAVPPHAEISKTALGAERSVSWRHVDDTLAEVMRLKGRGVRIAVLEQAADSVALHDFNEEYIRSRGWKEPGEWMLVVGNEVNGVDQRIVDGADVVLGVPMYGVKHSLNVSVSAGIALWAMTQIIR